MTTAATVKHNSIPQKIRYAVWRMYHSTLDGKCFVCESDICIENFHCGHVLSRNEGGTDEISNLRPICSSCNLSMGTQNMDEFKKQYFKPSLPLPNKYYHIYWKDIRPPDGQHLFYRLLIKYDTDDIRRWIPQAQDCSGGMGFVDIGSEDTMLSKLEEMYRQLAQKGWICENTIHQAVDLLQPCSFIRKEKSFHSKKNGE